MGFSALDYGVLTLYLAASVAFGLRLGRGQKNLDDYFLAGRHLPWWAISLSIVATETSTLTFIGAPAISYQGDLTFLQLAMGYIVGRILVSLVLIPAYFQGRIQTAYELLQYRFGGHVRHASALLFQVTRALADGVRLFATALVLSVITHLGVSWTVLIIGAVTLLYTLFGGMRAVVWNDVVQLLIYMAGGLIAFAVILHELPGGWPQVVLLAAPLHKFRIFNFSNDLGTAYTFWAGLVGGGFLTFATHGTDQMMVQRYLACGNRHGSSLAVIFSGIFVFFQFGLFLLIGVMLFAFYQKFPLAHPLAQTDRVFPIFIATHIPSGIAGLILAAIFAAAMSTLSSSLNSLASSSVNDFYRVFMRPQASEQHYLKVSRIATLGWAVVLVLVSLLARNWGSVLEVGLTITSITMGSVLGVFLLGLWMPRVHKSAALVGMLGGLLIMLGVAQLHWVAWTWYVFIGTGSTFAVGAAWQRLSKRNQ